MTEDLEVMPENQPEYKYQRIILPPELQAKVDEAKANTLTAIEEGKIPDTFAGFVDGLFKEMDTINATLIHSTLGIAGEAGELVDAVKKTWVYGKELDLENCIEELSDMLFYIQKFINMLGLTLEDVIYWNQNKLIKRYPEGKYTDEQAIARADKQVTIKNSPGTVIGDNSTQVNHFN